MASALWCLPDYLTGTRVRDNSDATPQRSGLFGPRLATTVGTETARRVPNLDSGSYRIVSALLGDRLRKSDGAGVASATPEVAHAAETELAEAEAKSPIAAADPELPEVVPNVPQAVGRGFPEPPGQGSRRRDVRRESPPSD
jgi:hypothetical protein